jgi:hypothetical protein
MDIITEWNGGDNVWLAVTMVIEGEQSEKQESIEVRSCEASVDGKKRVSKNTCIRATEPPYWFWFRGSETGSKKNTLQLTPEGQRMADIYPAAQRAPRLIGSGKSAARVG